VTDKDRETAAQDRQMAGNDRVLIYNDLAQLSAAAAEQIYSLALDAIRVRSYFTFVLSGGGTPEGLYRLLASRPYQSRFPWESSHLFWGDERCVPPDQPGSNYGRARELLLEHVAVPAENVHRMKGELEPERAAADYARQLARLATGDLPWPRFDVVLLGVGEDGHTASLFPGAGWPEEPSQAVEAVTAQYEDRPANRVTLTAQVINSARHVMVLAAGSKKSAAVAMGLRGPRDPLKWPIQRIDPSAGVMAWLLDEAAASSL
jgi:6-phosphogluconolactonase